MQQTTLGRTGLQVSRLGAGLSEIGSRLTFEEESTASQVLNTALDAGINFLDTAACYNISEELIGRTIAHRRDEYVLATKCGHVTGDYQGEAWTAQTVTDSIDRSLTRMKTDHLDLVQLHSCNVDVLEKGEVIEALQSAQKAGKTRFIGYSGDNENAKWAVDSGLFDTLQISFNLVEQHARTRLFAQAKAQNMGIIIKRPIANGAWGATFSLNRNDVTILEMAYQNFDPEQLMWGSDYPPVSQREGYANSLHFPMAELESKPEAEREMIFGGTAAKLFKFE